MTTQSTTPILILTGFLGAGKTTLLKRCLLNTVGLRIALVRNEFTAAEDDLTLECPILLKEEDEEDYQSFWELPNSCVCCTMKSQFLQGVSKMVKKARACQKPFDLVLVEISGVADPVAMASSLISEGSPDEDVIRLGGIISVIDASRIDKHLYIENATHLLSLMGRSKEGKIENEEGLKYLLLKQLCTSDLILLNKKDLVEEIKIKTLQAQLEQLVLEATIIPTEHCEFDLSILRKLAENSNQSKLNAHLTTPSIHSHPIDVAHGVSIPGLSKYVWKTRHTINLDIFEESLSRLLWTLTDEQPSVQLFRAKGILASDAIYEVQVVGDSVQITPVEMRATPKTSCCLFVGLNLPSERIEKALNASTIPSKYQDVDTIPTTAKSSRT